MRPKRRRLPGNDVERESAQQAARGLYPEEVAWVAGEDKSTEFTYDIGTEDISTKEVQPTEKEPHETLRVTRYAPYLPTRRTVDLPGDYGFTVSSGGLQIVHDTRVSPRLSRKSADERRQSVTGDDGSDSTVRVRRSIREGKAPQQADASATEDSDQTRSDLYERLQPRGRSGRRRSSNHGPLGGKPQRKSRQRPKGHWFKRGRER